MKTFLICPVRGVDQREAGLVVSDLSRSGYSVYWPPRDTDQNDPTGIRICDDNLKAIYDAHTVHIIWDGKSQGCLFDMGMAFALGKSARPVSLPPQSEGKSFQNMVREWAKR